MAKQAIQPSEHAGKQASKTCGTDLGDLDLDVSLCSVTRDSPPPRRKKQVYGVQVHLDKPTADGQI